LIPTSSPTAHPAELGRLADISKPKITDRTPWIPAAHCLGHAAQSKQ
jgi:hypothetical protein